LKVLFISSGNSGQISPIVKAQGISLKEIGIEVEYYLIQGKGIWGYLKNIPSLRRYSKMKNIDVFHAHYSFCGFAAALAGCNPLIVSLMGSDAKGNFLFKFCIKFFMRFFWSHTIVKSQDMIDSLGIKNASIIPNGVDLNQFKPDEKNLCREKLGWELNKTHLLFAANPTRWVKNFNLVEKAFNSINDKNIELHTLVDVDFGKMNDIYNASDIVLLSSYWEGSPNVIKEAMACNKIIVCTEVGDVKEVFGKTPGTFLSGFETIEFRDAMHQAIDFHSNQLSGRGRDRIKELKIDSINIAKKIQIDYQRILKK
jgi:glycosyltransferase involved in cell wall biosynthesis